MEHEALPLATADILLYLAAAGVGVPLLHRLGMGQVAAFLLVGVLSGPHVAGRLAQFAPWLGLFTYKDPHTLERLGELGVVFLLFTLGLELSLDRLAALRRWMLGLGSLQVLVTGGAIAAVAFAFGNPPAASVLVGSSLALSSTAVVMQLLIEQRRQTSEAGRIAFAVLLAQDVAVVPILLLAGLLTGLVVADPWAALAETVILTALALASLLLLGPRVVRPLLRLASRAGGREVLVAAALLMVIGSASLTAMAGASPGLGAFIAGVLLAESEFRHTIEADIEPFKGLLLGLFFVIVGTTVDPLAILPELPTILLSVFGLACLKALLLFGLGAILGLPLSIALEVGILLGQGGEFALVVVALARDGALLSAEAARFLVAVILVSMLATPLLARLAPRVSARLRPAVAREVPGLPPVSEQLGHVVVAGFGRVGRTVAQLLEEAGIPWLALDLDPERVAEERRRGRPVFLGDAGRPEILARVRVDSAQALIVTLDQPATAERTVSAARRIAPALPIVARARDAAHARRLLDTGADAVVPETVEASLQLAGRAFEMLGLPAEEVQLRLARERDLLLAPEAG
ncbi:MAG: cation:proton antiporter [Geminicoccaceae bacterium]|nr:cation:proton antiporter [Geminicoccaceae bacterium]MCS7268865.1 cation:proton antiporter [Geminicoccaceae bacterium]MDW8125242.1 cation:proton antiporter [Geminicoccaceae bacterium]MDW8341005.1 cation:proton antiporter [Geminicoccaceae bacterium]